MRQSYLDYAMSVIVGVLLPTCGTALKARPAPHPLRHATSWERITGSRYKKVRPHRRRRDRAKYHPHGDNAVYDALVRHGAGLSRSGTP